MSCFLNSTSDIFWAPRFQLYIMAEIAVLLKHFQQKCVAVLRWTMRPKRKFPAKVCSGFALDNASKKSISSKSVQRFCVGECVQKENFQQKCAAFFAGSSLRKPVHFTAMHIMDGGNNLQLPGFFQIP